MNVLTKDGYLLFDKWYESIHWFRAFTGFFFVKKDNYWRSINIEELPFNDTLYEELFECGHYFMGKRIDGNYDIVSPYKIISDGAFDSIMWAEKVIWGMNVLYNGKYQHYTIWQSGSLIFYAHEVLISNPDSIIVGRNGLWFYYDGKSNPIPLFKYFSMPSNQ